MNTTKKTPPIVQLGAWLLSLIVFAIGFWHTHLGLKEMKPFGSEWGGLAIAGIVLLLILITYWYAVNGRKMALIFYVLGGIIFFVCNLNYFYPAYLTRQIVKEEATALNDTLQNYANQAKTLQSAGFGNKTEALVDYENLKIYKGKVVNEIKSFNGWGPETSEALKSFDDISKKYGFRATRFSNEGSMTQATLSEIYGNYLEGIIQKVLETIMVNSKDKGVQSAMSFIKGVAELDTLQKTYTKVLKDSIIPDNSEINLEDVKTNPQIDILQKLVTGINDATSKINKATKPDSFKFEVLEESPSRTLGRIANTFKSIKDRITKVDTWAIIILCLFVDLIVPLAIYLLLRKKEDEEEESGPVYTGPEKF
jgi:hypothetical protein